jgi:hypothetical protein
MKKWAGSIKRKRDEERTEKKRVERERREKEDKEKERRRRKEERQWAEEVERQRQRRLRDRGPHSSIVMSNSEAQSKFMEQCGTTKKFKTVKYCWSVFDGGFFISRDNGKSYWSGLPGELSSRLVDEDKNTQGAVQYIAASETGAHYAELDSGEVWWDTTGLRDLDTFDQTMRDDGDARRVEFGADGRWIVLFKSGGSSWSSELPTALHNKLNSRNPRLPKASEVTLGPNDTWFVR